MVTVRHSIWHEPRPADVPPIGRLDWLLVGVALRDEVGVRDQKVAALSDEAKGVSGARRDIVGTVPPALLTLYEKLRTQRGSGAAKLHRGQCTGCQLQINVADLDGFRKAPANQVLRCVECDRILVRTADSGLK